MKVDTYAVKSGADINLHTRLGVRGWPDVEFSWFRSRLEAPRVSSHTEALWYNETVFLWMIMIYIYIYIYIDDKNK